MSAKNWLRGAIAAGVLALPALPGCGDNAGTGTGSAPNTGSGASKAGPSGDAPGTSSSAPSGVSGEASPSPR